MSTTQSVACIVFVVLGIADAGAQPPASTRRPQPKPRAAHLVVRDVSGTPLEEVRIAIAPSEGGAVATDARGTAAVTLPDGSYRFRFERHGFITLEREVTIRNGQPAEIAVVLNREPTTMPPAAPAPLPEPAPAPAPPPRPVSAPGTPVNLSLPGFLENNFIGREPLKESVLSCTPDETTRLLQLRDPVASHAHNASDEILYVVAGNGAIHIGDQAIAIAPGFLSVIPAGTSHAIERRGKNPLIVLSTIAGEPCSKAVTGSDQR